MTPGTTVSTETPALTLESDCTECGSISISDRRAERDDAPEAFAEMAGYLLRRHLKHTGGAA